PVEAPKPIEKVEEKPKVLPEKEIKFAATLRRPESKELLEAILCWIEIEELQSNIITKPKPSAKQPAEIEQPKAPEEVEKKPKEKKEKKAKEVEAPKAPE